MSCLQAKLPRGLESLLAVHIMLNAAGTFHYSTKHTRLGSLATTCEAAAFLLAGLETIVACPRLR